MPQIFDISNWSELPWYSTGGTRAKKFVQSPEGEYFYFKRSQYKEPTASKPGKDFKYEFWSEIIAYEIGTYLGFKVLKYDIAYDSTIMGCISKSMFDAEKQHFLEGIRFLQGYNLNYNPDNKAHRAMYNFQAIEAALDKFALSRFIKDIVETIVFDSVIGNGDRHQENWAIIMEHSAIPSALDRIKIIPVDDISSLDKNAFYDPTEVAFAPIYDSGSSLGRELTEQRIVEITGSGSQLEAYINKGLSEIHWMHKKISHFDLLKKLLETQYKSIINNVSEGIFAKSNSKDILEIVSLIDLKVPVLLEEYKIPQVRKEFITKLIITRIEMLKKLLNARI